MKNLPLFVVLIFFAVACKKDKSNDCIEEVCMCPDTVYFVRDIVVDTFVIAEAEYIERGEIIHGKVHVDSFRHGMYRTFNVSAVHKYELQEVDSLSFVYLGGVRGAENNFSPIAASWSCDTSQSVMIATDTVYHFREQHIPYAILQIYDGTTTFIDTTFYPMQLAAYHNAEIDNLLKLISSDFVENGYLTDEDKFNKYIDTYYNIGNSNYYLIDIYPSSEYEASIYNTRCILFKERDEK